jgi:hypothetical protein
LPGQKRLDALRASYGASDGSRSEDQEIPQQIKGDWILVNIEVEELTKTLQLATVIKGLVLHFVESQDLSIAFACPDSLRMATSQEHPHSHGAPGGLRSSPPRLSSYCKAGRM